MRLKILHLFLKVDKQFSHSATQLRGFLGNKFKGFTELHHHLSTRRGAKLLYSYPKIQYKIHQNFAIILGIGTRCISTLRHVVMNLDKLELNNTVYKIEEIKANYEEPEFRLTKKDSVQRYEFYTPWLALNETNYRKFQDSSLSERRELLNRILIGNILSVSKSLNYTVPDTIYTETELYPISTKYKDVKMVGFKGKFEVNFLIPDYMGLGKGVSHGFGAVKRING
ncbi:MAG: hypothetical protein GF311_26380 [Candidatus Lokiarchaeota archaeon]|nr:hypothetical protein [Candidatus Lokiarchaeota archaeon]